MYYIFMDISIEIRKTLPILGNYFCIIFYNQGTFPKKRKMFLILGKIVLTQLWWVCINYHNEKMFYPCAKHFRV